MPTIVITGASQGIGKAIALRMAQLPDAHLVLMARNEEKLGNTAKECKSAGAQVLVCPCDVTSEAAVSKAAEQTLSTFGTPDVLVNNAGVFTPGSIMETTLESFTNQVAVNLTSAFIVTRAFLPSMLDQGKGTLFFMASVASIRPYAGGSAYCAAKHGLLGLARVVREETKDQGIRVITLLPGATLTPSWDGVDLPEERFIPPEDIAAVVADTLNLSPRTVVEEIIIRPQAGDI